ncbi:hypothetical protein M407DRAFT_22116 [Tulasnella calospora MUT 4182]|uniref:Uncharacterized protein n=1 Tax=Tulasnella calospora MUT 4182 TaxID=1051891 RepID=A0A0C3M4S8_9AGAM|nr:hypothetical protein M407DRAFT_22116 [Tulasnella calospora MUT 4182]
MANTLAVMPQAEENGTPARPTETHLRTRLAGILSRRPEGSKIEGQETTIPAGIIGPVLDDYSAEYGITILTPEHQKKLAQVTEAIRDQPINLDMLLKFIAEYTAASPSGSPGPEHGSPPDMQASMDEVVERGRQDDRDSHPQSRSSSNDSVATSYYRPDGTRRTPSIPSTPGGQTVSIPWTPSPFDSQHRQRAVPLQNAPPSAFHRKPAGPSRRRKSEGSASGMSDSEQPSFGPRRRAPSNPVSPQAFQSLPLHGDSPDTSIELRSPPGSAGQSPDNSFVFPSTRRKRSTPPQQADSQADDSHHVGDDSLTSVDLLLASQSFGSDDEHSDEDLETASMTDTLIRPHLPSDASISTPEERVEALQRVNADLNRKLKENDRTLMARLQEREIEIGDLEARLEEMKNELQATKKEEKELRNKERMTSKQLANFEADIARMTRMLENSKTTYQTMLKQYNEQCTLSETYRNSLRHKDNQIKDIENALKDRMKELDKSSGEKEILEHQIKSLQEDIDGLRTAHRELEDQKHENLLLKETIDRLRFDLDHLRAELQSTGSRAGTSAPGTFSKSWANEMANRLVEEEAEVEGTLTGDITVESPVQERHLDADDEDIVETIITTQRRRKVGNRTANNTIMLEDVKEYADAFTQHDMSETTKSAIVQTTPPPSPPRKVSMDIQTDSEPEPPVRLMASIEVQTDPLPEPKPIIIREPAPEPEAGPSRLSPTIVVTDAEEDLSSSVETVKPESSTASSPLPIDSPPSYDNIAENERHKLMQKWHPGLHGHPSANGVKGGISSNVLREWANVKKELGFDCVAIDKTLEASQVNGPREEEEDLEEEVIAAGRRGTKKFYNIYNTYVVPNLPGGPSGQAATPDGSGSSSKWRDFGLVAFGASAVLLAVGLPVMQSQYLQEQHYIANSIATNGGPTPHGFGDSPYYDAFWLIMEKVFLNGLNAARRVPPFNPT